MKGTKVVWVLGIAALMMVSAGGCSQYSNSDPCAASIELTPAYDTNPVGTQHVLVATVKDKDGNPLCGRTVEWMIPEGNNVGSFVEVDKGGIFSPGKKVNNTYAVTKTNNTCHVISRGNSDKSDNVVVYKGQTWAVITSAEEGVTNVIAYAPGVYDWQKHKAFATKVWADMAYEWPADATNPVGAQHPMRTRIKRASDGQPIKDLEVTYRLLSGPDGYFDTAGQKSVTVKTDADGVAATTFMQAQMCEGQNEIEIAVSKSICGPCVTAKAVAVKKVLKCWVGPKIGITKCGPPTAAMNDVVTYTITVNNPSNVTARNVTVVDTIPAGTQYVSSAPQGAAVAGQKVTWSLGDLGPQGKRDLSVQVKLINTGRFCNSATVTADGGLTATAEACTVVTCPKLVVSKRGPEQVLICDPICYTIEVRNTGDAPATNVRVVDTLPDGLTTDDGAKAKSFDLGTIAAGQTKSVQLQARAAKPGEYLNKIDLTADNNMSGSCTWKTVVKQPVLVVTKSGPELRYVGRKATYEIALSNKGDVAAEKVKLVDNVPENVRLLGASKGSTCAGNKVVWDVGTLKMGETQTFSVEVDPLCPGKFTNVAEATSTCGTARGEHTMEVRGVAAILLEMVDLADPVEVGADTTYCITVTNQGSTAGTNIRLTGVMSEPISFVNAKGPTKEKVDGKKILFDPIKTLGPGQSATYNVTVRGNKSCDTRFGVSVLSDQVKEPVIEEESTHFYADK